MQWFPYQLRAAAAKHETTHLLDLLALAAATMTLRFARRRTTLVGLKLADVQLVVTTGATAEQRVPALVGKSSTEKASDPHGNRLLSHDQIANSCAADNGRLDVAWLLYSLQSALGQIHPDALQQLPLGAVVPCEAGGMGDR